MKNLRSFIIMIILGVLIYILGYHWVTNLGMILLALTSLIVTIPIYVRGKRIVKERKVIGTLMIILSLISFVIVGIFIVTTLLGILKGGI